MVSRHDMVTTTSDASGRSLHPLAKQQLQDATEAHGQVDVNRLLTAVSACYEASASLALDVLEHNQPSPAADPEDGLPSSSLME